MKVDVQATGVLLPRHAYDELRQRIAVSLQRVSDRVRSVRVSLRETLNDRGAADRTCLVEATLARGGRLIVVRKCEHLAGGLNSALRIVRRRINRTLRKQRSYKAQSLQGVYS